MKHFFAALKFDENGKLVWNKRDAERFAEYGKAYAGESVAVQISKVSPLRSDEHLGLMRIRFRDLKKYTGYTTAELMHWFFRSCGLGHKLEDPPANAFSKFFVQDFERLSTNVLTTEDVNKIMKRLEEFRVYWNENEPPELHFEWSNYIQPMKRPDRKVVFK